MTTTVVHYKKEPYDIYIGRPSKWGNPFVVGRDGTRAEVVERYREYLHTDGAHLRKDIHELKDKVLGCWCKPQACHGDVLAELANNIKEES